MQSSASPTGPSLATLKPAARRQVVPILNESASASEVSKVASGALGAAPRQASYTANLEAQVRVLEHEVHLLRTGLQQNERLCDISAANAPPPPKRSSSASTKRIRFISPSSVALSPPRPSSSASSRAAAGVVDRPRIAFGQRVNPTHPRVMPYSGPSVDPLHKRRAESLRNRSLTSARTRSASSSSTTPPTSVRLSSAPVAAPTSTSSTSPAAATVWASADPNVPRPSVTATAAGTPAANSQLFCYPFRTTPAPLPAAAPTPALPEPPLPSAAQHVGAPGETTMAVASPIVVAMSSDGSLPVSLAHPALPTAEPPAQRPLLSPPPPSSLSTTTHPPVHHRDASPSVSAITTTVGESAVRAGATSSVAGTTTVAQLEAEVLSLRDTLAQQEALLHRVLRAFHDQCNNSEPRHQSAGTVLAAPDTERQRSQEVMHLLAKEVCALQTQLSNARTAHQQIVTVLQGYRQEAHQAPPPPPPPPQATAPEPTTSTAAASQPAKVPLEEQLDTALRKLKAWEEWYTTSGETNRTTAGGDNTVAGARDAPSPQQRSPQSTNISAEKQVRDASAAATRGSHSKKSNHKREKRAHEVPASIWCPHCGFALSAPSKLKTCGETVSEFVPLGFGPPRLTSASSLQRPSTAPPSAPYTSAYALNSALYNSLTNPYGARHTSTNGTVAAEPDAVANDSGNAAAAAATPPPPSRSEEAAVPSQSAEVGKKKVLTAHQNAIAGATQASPMWAVPMGRPSTAGVGNLGQTTSNLYVSPYCDRLDHAQQQAYSTQQLIAQLAREAAVRDLAETERQVAEQRLLLWKQVRSRTHDLSSTPNEEHVAGVRQQESVE